MRGAPIVIVGAGQAAQQAVASLRSEGFDGDIVLFGDEAQLPYQRPPLSKAFLAGETDGGRLELRPQAFYADHGIDLRLGQKIEGIDVRGCRVLSTGGAAQGYSALLIATGTRPRALPIAGDGLRGVHHMRAIRDAERFRAEFCPGARLVIIGGGYIGLEVAAKARSLGLAVTVIESQPRILARVACAPTAGRLMDLHGRHGVDILTGTGVAAIEGRAGVEAVRTTAGRRIPADLVLIAVGATPNAELAAGAGLAVDNGILVDASTRTTVPNIHAAGDVASFPSRLYGRRIRLESVPNAIDQAKAAAAAMLGKPVTYDPVPWFWTDQYDCKLQIAGLSQGHTDVAVSDVAEPGRFSARYFCGERLIAVDSLNDPRSHLMARRELAAQPPQEVAA